MKTADRVAIAFQLAVTAIEHEVSRPVFLERDAINRALVGRSIIDLDIGIVQIYLVAVWHDFFAVIAILDNRLQSRLIALVGAQVES